MARDTAQIAFTCHRVSALAGCHEHISAKVALDAVLPALRTRLDAPNVDVVLPALADVLARHALEHTRPAAAAAASPAAVPLPVGDPTVTADLALLRATWRPLVQQAWDAAGEDALTVGALEDTITDIVASDLDGQLLCWEVITRESTRHHGLIMKEAGKLARALPDCTVDELIGHGWKGLRVALRQYDPSLGFAFSTFACPRINGAIRDGVRAENPIPKRLTTFVRSVSAAEEALTQALSRPPSYAEIRAYLDSTDVQMSLLPRLTTSASLDELTNPWGENSREPSCLIDVADPEAEAVQRLRDEAVRRAVEQLPADQARAIDLLYLQEIPIGEAAAALGVDTRTLRAAKRRGMLALEGLLADWAHTAVPA